MNSILRFFAISILTLATTTSFANEWPNQPENIVTQPALSGIINIYVDGSLAQVHSVSGTSGNETNIRRLYVGNNDAEGAWSGSSIGASGVCGEDSSPHHIRIKFTPNSANFVINLYVDTTVSAGSFCF